MSSARTVSLSFVCVHLILFMCVRLIFFNACILYFFFNLHIFTCDGHNIYFTFVHFFLFVWLLLIYFMLCQLSYAVRSVRVCDISEPNLVPSISM
jgi:hypothetical protein